MIGDERQSPDTTSHKQAQKSNMKKHKTPKQTTDPERKQPFQNNSGNTETERTEGSANFIFLLITKKYFDLSINNKLQHPNA